MKKLLFIAIFVLTALSFSLSAQEITPVSVAPHPRLLLERGDITRMRDFAASRENAQLIHQQLIAKADAILSTTPVSKELVENGTLDGELSQRIFTLAYAFVMTENMEYSRRAEQEMLNISLLKKWNSENLAELTLAAAIGYDWLFNSLPVHSRSIIGTAIYEKSLRNITQLEGLDEESLTAFAYGALATMERAPEFYSEFIRKVIAHCNTTILSDKALNDFAYSDFASLAEDITDKVVLVAALQSALGKECGLTLPEGFMQSAEYLDFMVAPSGVTYDLGNLPSTPSVVAAKYWFASQADNASVIASDERRLKEKSHIKEQEMPLYMIFASSLDLNHKGTRANAWGKQNWPVYVYRSGWEQPTDTYFIAKGGSFVYESEGIQWAIFKACDSQDKASAKLTESFASSSRKGAVIDLGKEFAEGVRSAIRTIELDKKSNLTIFDHIVVGEQPMNIEWKIDTKATAEVVGPSNIKLSYNGKDIFIKMRCKGRSKTSIQQDGDMQRVGFDIEAKANQELDIEVEISTARSSILNRLGEKLKGNKSGDK